MLTCLAAGLLAAWPAQAEVGMQHLAALEGALQACGEARAISEVMKLEVDTGVAQGYIHAGDAGGIKQRMTAEAAAERFAPLYAHISEAEAGRLSAWCASGGGKVLVRQHIDESIRHMKGWVRVPARRSASEQRLAAAALRDTSAVHTLRRLYTAPDGARREAQRWMQETVFGRGAYLADLADVMQAIVDRPGQELPSIAGDGSTMGGLVQALRQELNRMVEQRRKHDEAIMALARSAPMDGATLTDPQRLAASRACVEAVRATLSAMLTDMEGYPERVRVLVTRHNLPPAVAEAVLKGMETGASQLYDWSLRMGENQRAIMRMYEAVLALGESETGYLRYADGMLYFDRDDALAKYRALASEASELLAVEDKLLAEQREHAQANIRKLRAADLSGPQ